jgi:hypothetical protein
MKNFNKVMCVGAAKTGTTTCGDIFNKLGLKNTALNKVLWKKHFLKNKFGVIYEHFNKYDSFNDWPWKGLYKEFDERHPNSKFILTQRKNYKTAALSAWYHNNSPQSNPPDKFLEKRIKVLKEWDQDILNYFKDRKNDLLVVCWENGDEWGKVCNFLGLPIPDIKFPHRKKRFSNDRY